MPLFDTHSQDGRMKLVSFNTTTTTVRTYTGMVPDDLDEETLFFEGPDDYTEDMDCDISETQEELVRGTFEELEK